jgi:dTDP-4-dehydrorhamnose reductase
MGNIVSRMIEKHPGLSGVWQVSSKPISKYELLKLINDKFGLGITIEPSDEVHCDRSLDSSKFTKETGYKAPSWESMIESILKDETMYEGVKT